MLRQLHPQLVYAASPAGNAAHAPAERRVYAHARASCLSPGSGAATQQVGVLHERTRVPVYTACQLGITTLAPSSRDNVQPEMTADCMTVCFISQSERGTRSDEETALEQGQDTHKRQRTSEAADVSDGRPHSGPALCDATQLPSDDIRLNNGHKVRHTSCHCPVHIARPDPNMHQAINPVDSASGLKIDSA